MLLSICNSPGLLQRRRRRAIQPRTTRRARPAMEGLEDRTTPASVWYVNDDAAGGNTGLTWADAFTNLQSALGVAAAGDEVWVAAGVYKPTRFLLDHREFSFVLKSDVALYGGFGGNDETARGQRDWQANGTALSGDLLDNDPADSLTRAENSLHVVDASDVTGAVLDGFTITAGNADGGGGGGTSIAGGGLINFLGSPTIANVIFSDNWAAAYGGGAYSYGGSPVFTDVTFSGNFGFSGGGMFTNSGTLTDVVFSGNSAQDGGGLYVDPGSLALTNVTFSGNYAFSLGGGLYNTSGSPALAGVVFAGNTAGAGGGLYNETGLPALTGVVFSGNTVNLHGGGVFNYFGSPALTNVVFRGNSAGVNGGGTYNETGSPTLVNVTISGNSAGFQGGGVASGSGMATLTNSIVWGNTAGGAPNGQLIGGVLVTSSIIQGVPGGSGGNLGDDPRFVDAASGNLHLLSDSPAIDAGINAGAPAFDLDGVPRPVDGDNDGSAVVDMGAYEYRPTWVNYDWIEEANAPGGTLGVLDPGDLVGDGAAVTGKIYGADAFATVTEGVAAVLPFGGAVHVLAGTYDESVDTTGKVVTLVAEGRVIVTGGLTLDGNDSMTFDVRGPLAGTGYDQWVISGPVSMGGAILAVAVDPAHVPALGSVYTLIDGASPNEISGTFAGLPDRSNATLGGHDFWADYHDALHGDGHDFTLLRDRPPVSSIGLLAGIFEGDGVTLDGGACTDPDAGDVLTRYEWTVNGNAAGAGATLALNWSDLVGLGVNDGVVYPGTEYPVTLTVTDAAGLSSNSAGTLFVRNANPTVAFTGLPAFGVEGTTSITLTATVSDPSPVDAFTYRWYVSKVDLAGFGTTFTTGTDPSLTFTPDDSGGYWISLTVSDKDGGSGYSSPSFLVVNVPPAVAVTGDSSVAHGMPYTLTLGAVVDPGQDVVFLYRVFWGDGAIDSFAGSPPATATHTYAGGPNTYSTFVDVTDEDGTYAVAARSVQVLGETAVNQPPTAVSPTNVAASLSGAVYLDHNANGVQNPGEPGAAGWTVYVDGNNNGLRDAGELAALVDGAGFYRFDALAAGEFTLRIDLMPGDVATSHPDGQAVTVVGGKDDVAVALGLRHQLTVIPVAVVDTLFHPGQGADAGEDTVMALYRAILGREADGGGLAHHVGLLRGLGAAGVVDSLWNSAEHRTQQVDAYYVAYLGRHLDSAGSGWVDALLAGADEEAVAAGILASAEYAARHGDDADFVRSLYPELLGRASAEEEIGGHVAGLASGISRQEVALRIMRSAESASHAVDALFSSTLERTAELAGTSAWARNISSGALSLSDVARSLLFSEEFLVKAHG